MEKHPSPLSTSPVQSRLLRSVFVLAALLASFLLLPVSLAAQSEAKTALLIANGKYTNFGSLANPVPEAKALKAALEGIGFKVTLLSDASKDAMVDALSDFEAELKQRGGIAFFHYGGHGIQVGGKSFLIPATAEIPDEKRVSTRALDVDEIMAALDASGSSANIVVLDACRNNPLPASSGRSASRGLSPVGFKPKNSITVYSAESGNVAQDGLFTPALTLALKQPGKSFQEMLQDVRRRVSEKSGGTQRPGNYDETIAPIYLASASTQATALAPQFDEIVVTPGTAALTFASAGTLNFQGQTRAVPAGGTLPVRNLAPGDYTATVTYPDGQTENLTVTVEPGKTANVAFVYKPAPKPQAGQGFTNSVGMDFVPVAGGSFQMGGLSVTLSSFYMAKTEVTQAQYRQVTGQSPSKFNGNNLPVEQVSWYDAVAYCNALSQKEGKQAVYTINGTNVSADLGKNGYRLPTEAEWEYAAKGGKDGVAKNYTYAGSNNVDEVAWHSKNVPDDVTKPVAGKVPNQLGLYDMSGNVWEWCNDWYSDSLAGGNDPQGANSGQDRVLRGGSWAALAVGAQSSFRGKSGPKYPNFCNGFRVVCR